MHEKNPLSILSCKTSHSSSFFCAHFCRVACSFAAPFSSFPEILHLYSTAVSLTQPILLHSNLKEETASLLLLLLSPQTGGLSGLIYNAA